MKVSVLTDNHAGSHVQAEHGLSYFIEHEGERILFDTGQSDLFLKNAAIMSINPRETDHIVLSHGHYDHGDGLHHIAGRNLICHPGCFVRRYSGADRRYIGLNNSRDELSHMFELSESAGPFRITDKIVFLGEIPRVTEFESKSTTFIFEDGSPDYVADDSALAIVLSEGLFVISGCGHSGVVNIMEYARKVTGINRIVGIMGGFHLKGQDVQTSETISYLRKEHVQHIFPSHCTELPALTAFYNTFSNKQIKTGDVLTFN